MEQWRLLWFPSVAGRATPIPLEASDLAQATPVTSLDVLQLGDRLAWAPDNQHVIVAVAGMGNWLMDTAGTQTPLTISTELSVTAITWSMSGQSFALGTWDPDTRSAAILTLSLQNPAGSPATVLALPVNDGRYIRSMVWGTEDVGVVFSLRSTTGDMTASNDLYSVRRLGSSMVLIASAGVAAPIAAIDQVALADNGTTIAFAIQVPGRGGIAVPQCLGHRCELNRCDPGEHDRNPESRRTGLDDQRFGCRGNAASAG